ncbi:hypothetical protein SANA_06620 [Gottschalkiaceae bacterium SANA]|nr:hypothetical protein SANA_06620 [Gottschalkiaceae bacterium SANA]
MKTKKYIKVLALVVVTVLLLSGCTIRGGGLLMDCEDPCAHPSTLTTFGINAVIEKDPCCDDRCCEYDVSGHFTYFDKQECVKIKGTVEGGMVLDFDPCKPGAIGTVYGEYTDMCGATGACCIMLYDSDYAGQFKCDAVAIKLLSGPEEGYNNFAPLLRGNIKIRR